MVTWVDMGFQNIRIGAFVVGTIKWPTTFDDMVLVWGCLPPRSDLLTICLGALARALAGLVSFQKWERNVASSSVAKRWFWSSAARSAAVSPSACAWLVCRVDSGSVANSCFFFIISSHSTGYTDLPSCQLSGLQQCTLPTLNPMCP